ncbi:MAG: hypothetical protein ACOCQD_02960 [archaeon]
MAKEEKVFTLEEQLEKMNELHGIPVEDSSNVFSKYKKTLETLVDEQVDAGTKKMQFNTPVGNVALGWVEESKKINSSDGVEYTVPAHYVGNFSFPKWMIDMSNKNVDFSTIPSSSEIAKSKTKAA